MRMTLGKLNPAILLCTLSLALAACGEWRGSKEVGPDGGDLESRGPGLFTGKEGGIVLYNDVWWGAAPGDGVRE